MKNLFLDNRTARDIDDRVSRVHRDLGHQSGTLALSEVRALLKLDLAYYRTDDPGVLGEVVHKLRVGAKQVLARPGLLIDAVRRFDLKALFVPDRKQILLDAGLPDLKKRWSEGHEIVHSLIPWHSNYLLGDNRGTLVPSCHDRIEAEANYGAGRLLFPKDQFAGSRAAASIDLARIRVIAGHFGNTITSTLWRCVEEDDRPCFGAIGEHPHFSEGDKPPIEHLVQSRPFAERFSGFSENRAIELIRGYSSTRRRGPLGMAEIVLVDDNDDQHIFLAETFFNSYHALTIGQYLRPKAVLVQVTAPVAYPVST